MKTMGTLLRVMVISWLCLPACAGSPDPEPASGETVSEVIANPCSFAGDGVYCGSALPSPPVPVHSTFLYTCLGHNDQEEKGCSPSCSIQAPGVPDRCNPDPCANASNGKFCGTSTQLGFNRASASSYVLYTCSGGRTTASQFCSHICNPAPAGTPDHC
jgi:hypothetical protein